MTMKTKITLLAVLGAALVCETTALLAADVTTMASPNKELVASVAFDGQRRLTLSLVASGATVLEASPLGITIDGKDLGMGGRLGQATSREIHETYACRGVKSQAVNHCMAYEIPIQLSEGGAVWQLDVRVFNDGVACRYSVPGTGLRRVTGEATSWRLPKGAVAWFQTNTANYEGEYQNRRLEDIPVETSKGKVGIGCPVTIELSQGGYALLTEACLYHYSGMTLQPTGSSTLVASFEDDPLGWDIEGRILTPWRVTLATKSLDGLLNSDVICNLGEPPDAGLFPQGANTSWIKPGRGLITWAVFLNDGAQWYRQKWFVDMCAAMNCEYLLVDGGWRSEKWGFLKDGGDLWGRLRELCQYAAARKVGIFVWNAYPEGRDDGPGLTNRQTRNDFLRRCKEAGVKGVKIDFFDSERKEIIDVYEDILRETARLQLMVNFHGANKPTGEVRTWPHEITREGIREQEYVLWEQLPLSHYGALPFTRMAAGHGDFLPGFVRPKYLKNTTAVFQMATAIAFTSPFICWPDHPEAYLESPFLGLVRALPPVWDETRVLDGSAIGCFVALARRSGPDWYVAILNCTEKETRYDLPLSFLGNGDYSTTLYRDGEGPSGSATIEMSRITHQSDRLPVHLKGGGGFVAQMRKPKAYSE